MPFKWPSFSFGSNATLQVLPGVYFGHLEPPNVSRLPASGRIVPWYKNLEMLSFFVRMHFLGDVSMLFCG